MNSKRARIAAMAKKRNMIILVSIFAFCVSGSVFFYITGWIPHQKMRELIGWENASEDEIRTVSHQILRYPVGNHHDAFLALEKVGNAKSVPLLIRALKWHEPSAEDDFIVCTTDHCISALQSLTGVDCGTSYAAWNKWWNDTGSTLPAEAFYPRAS